MIDPARVVIQFPPGDRSPVQEGPTVVEFVDGPRAGQRELLGDQPPVIESAGAPYRRSVRCVDDGVLRYAFVGEAAAADANRGRQRGAS
jgi:hypothetical protein